MPNSINNWFFYLLKSLLAVFWDKNKFLLIIIIHPFSYVQGKGSIY